MQNCTCRRGDAQAIIDRPCVEGRKKWSEFYFHVRQYHCAHEALRQEDPFAYTEVLRINI